MKAKPAHANATAHRRAQSPTRGGTEKKQKKRRSALHPGQAWLFLCIWGCLLYWEAVVRLATPLPFWGTGLLFILFFSAALAGLFAALCSLLPRRGCYGLAIGLLALTGVIYIVQLFYYSIFSTYISAFSLLNGAQALQFGETIGGQLLRVWPWVLAMLLPLAAFIIFGRKLPLRRSATTAALVALLAVLVHFGSIALLPVFGTGLFSPYDYYHQSQALAPTADKLGLYTALRLDAQRLLLGGQTTTAQPPAQGSYSPAKPAGAAPGAGNEDSAERVLGPNMLDIDLAALAEAEENATIADMHRYFAGVEPTMQNEYTGLFEGYNLITITAESFAPYAVDPQRTPTLYKMMTGGINFTNFYTPLWDTSTLDGEYAICQGLVPKQGVWSMMITGERNHTLPFTLGNQFLAQGYNTFAYHNHNAEYYNRSVSHPNMGYNFKAIDAGLELPSSQWPRSDLEMVDATTAEFIGDGSSPFHVYYLTVSGHQPYESWNAMSQKNWDTVSGLSLSVQAKAYLACQVELDRALELLLQRLEEAGLADKTVIALTSDHPPYPLQMEGISELLGHPVDYQFEYFKNSFFIYSPGMQPVTVDKPCSSLDILPTLSNLFALPYDSRLLMGRDAFSDAEPLVMLANRGWITDRGRFSAYLGVITNLDEENPIDDEYFRRVNQTVADRFAYSAKIVETNYYAWLFQRQAIGNSG